MMTRLILCAATIFMLIAAFSLPSRAQSVITINLSYKIVLNPNDGSRPVNGSTFVSDADIDAAVAGINRLQEAYSRGYRFRRVDPIREVGGIGDRTGPSRWFNVNFYDDDKGDDWKDQMEDAARDDSRYAWNNDAINIYVTNGFCGGKCSVTGGLFSETDHIIIIGGCRAANERTQLHEIGHYFNLYHTQGRCGACNDTKTGECHTKPGDDEVDDTVPDLACWDRDDIARWSFKTGYANLSESDKKRVDDVFLNIMSYHDPDNRSRLTERQLDVWADTANSDRDAVVSGRTIFVDDNFVFRFQFGASRYPIGSVQAAVSMADSKGGDIVLIRPGDYKETFRISKLLTLRATRLGSVIIGRK